MAKRAQYINNIEFHEEMVKCKRAGKLSDKALIMFQKFANGVIRDFYFNNNEHKRDAIQQILHDMWKYWQGFKENNVVRVKFTRNLKQGDKICIKIHDSDIITYIATDVAYNYGEERIKMFQVEKKTNKSLVNFVNLVKQNDQKIKIFHDMVQKRVTMMESDVLEPNLSHVYIQYDPESESFLSDIKSGNLIFFQAPPNAFKYFTSICKNAVLKSLNKTNPKNHRNNIMISLSINSSNNEFYNI